MSAGTSRPEPVPERKVLFEHFAWHLNASGLKLDGTQAAVFAGTVRDVSVGVGTLLRMFERDDVDGDLADDENPQGLPTILSIHDRANLARLCITSLGMLGQEAEDRIARINDLARRAQGGGA